MTGLSTVTQKGQILLPKKVRLALGIQPKDQVSIVVRDGKAEVKKIPSLLSLGGIVKNAPPYTEETMEKEQEAIVQGYLRHHRDVMERSK